MYSGARTGAKYFKLLWLVCFVCYCFISLYN